MVIPKFLPSFWGRPLVAKIVQISTYVDKYRVWIQHLELRDLKNLLERPQMISKKLANSPEPILELEFHFEKFTKFAIFDIFCLRQRTEAIWCEITPLKGILQGSQRLEK